MTLYLLLRETGHLGYHTIIGFSFLLCNLLDKFSLIEEFWKIDENNCDIGFHCSSYILEN